MSRDANGTGCGKPVRELHVRTLDESGETDLSVRHCDYIQDIGF